MPEKFILHYGVKGMRWGVRKDNKKVAIRTPKTARLDLWQKRGHNALFITGLSGSGKSTFASDLANKFGCEAIHLDTYFEKSLSGNNPNFTNFLKKHGVTKDNMFKKDKDMSTGSLNYEKSDLVLPLIKQYGKPVIVEGVQLLDQTMSTKMRVVLSEEPVISLQTPKKLSVNRAMERDEIDSKRMNAILKQADYFYNQKTSLEKEIRMEIGKNYLDELLKPEV